MSMHPDMEPITDQRIDPSEIQLGKPMSFVGVTYRNIGEWLLMEHKGRTDSYIINFHFSMGGSSQNLGNWALYSLHTAQKFAE